MKFTTSLPQQVYSAKQVREHEAEIAQQQHISMYQLMENAGEAAFQLLQHQYDYCRRVLVVCGKGNNGGDGFILARLAHQAGLLVSVLVLTHKSAIQGDAQTALNYYMKAQEVIEKENIIFCKDANKAQTIISQFNGEVIVDAILGTGFHGELTPLLKQVHQAINQHAAEVLSIDVPSGLSAETSVGNKFTIVASITITFIALKKGLLTGQAVDYIGQLFFAGLAVDHAFCEQIATNTFLTNASYKPQLAPRKASSHKGDVGLVLALGGGKGMPGAIRLASEAALRSGAALVAVCCAPENQALVFNGRPELMLAPSDVKALKQSSFIQKCKAIVLGPGLGQTEWAQQLFDYAHQLTHIPLVVDADALRLLAQNPSINHNRVLTPHPAEAAALLHCNVDDIEQDRFAAVQAIVEKYGGICVLKGAGSLISNGKHTFINCSGNAGMASGGMGDVLSGIIAALSMQMPNLFTAVQLAVFLHGYAADIIAEQTGQRGMLASDLFSPLQYAINHLHNHE